MEKIVVRDRYKKCGLTFFRVFVVINMLFFWAHLMFNMNTTEVIHRNQINGLQTLHKIKCDQLKAMVFEHGYDASLLDDCQIFTSEDLLKLLIDLGREAGGKNDVSRGAY